MVFHNSPESETIRWSIFIVGMNERKSSRGKGRTMTSSNSRVIVRRTSRARQLIERGLTTIEYAIGLLAAATAALILIRVFNDNSFFQALTKWVLDIFAQVLSHI
ncbi:MAG: hypothetical protein CSA64_03940 [Arachnia propionica]|nr:MAG: hypothetical protein CSA64_03940 [Arachnia propionica]